MQTIDSDIPAVSVDFVTVLTVHLTSFVLDRCFVELVLWHPPANPRQTFVQVGAHAHKHVRVALLLRIASPYCGCEMRRWSLARCRFLRLHIYFQSRRIHDVVVVRVCDGTRHKVRDNLFAEHAVDV